MDKSTKPKKQSPTASDKGNSFSGVKNLEKKKPGRIKDAAKKPVSGIQNAKPSSLSGHTTKDQDAAPKPLTARQIDFVREYLIDIERFDSYVDRSGGDNACWPWTGNRDALGYGRFHIGTGPNNTMLAHRVAFGSHHGELAPAVCHRCDNPSCCNPTHLFGGTRADNNQDMMQKGRHWLQIDPTRAVRGEEHGQAKLTASQVKQIRVLYEETDATQRALAARFDVSQRTIAKIVTGQGWKHA